MSLFDLQWSTTEARVSVTTFLISFIVLIYLLRLNWKQYGLFHS